jgi:hypothetical protein
MSQDVYDNPELPESGTPLKSARVRSLVLSGSSATLRPATSNEEAYDRVLVSVTSSSAGMVFASGSQEAGFDIKTGAGVVTLYDGHGSGVGLYLKSLWWGTDTGGTTATATLWCSG